MKRTLLQFALLFFLSTFAFAQTNYTSSNPNSGNQNNPPIQRVDSAALKTLLKSQVNNPPIDQHDSKQDALNNAMMQNGNSKTPMMKVPEGGYKDKATIISEFAVYKEKFIDVLWRMYPGWATGVGYHAYDSILSVPDDSFRIKENKFIQNSKTRLAAFNKDSLPIQDRLDYMLISNFLDQTIWSRTQLKQYEWDPSMYNVAGDFSFILTENYQNLDTRLKSIYNKMNYVEAFYNAAKANIKNPTKEHTELAINQIKGGATIFTNDLIDSIKKSTLPATLKLDFIRKAAICANSSKDFVAFLQSIDMSKARSFRLGPILYDEKFKLDLQSQYSSAELLQYAKDRKAFLHDDMFKITTELWPKYFGNKPIPLDKLVAIRVLIDTISIQHAKPEDFQSTIEKQIPTLVKFINDKKLIYLDPSKPLKVRKEPAYMAGVAGASISSPGPYDKNGNTYYNVGSLAAMSKDEQESYLREYNNYVLQILNIHEAIPGHYTQGIYANQSPSIIKTIFSNGSMVEGWAVYSELMMIENGYGDHSPEMRLMYDKWNLRSVCNTILDISVHTGTMTETEAKNLLINEGFQQSSEANGKWKRVQLTSVQLCSYFNGFKEITDLRADLRKKEAEDFNLKKFHETFLSYGSIPVKYIRKLMMRER